MRIKQHMAFLLVLCTSISVGLGARSHTAYAATVAAAPSAADADAAGCKPPSTPLSDARMDGTMAGEPIDAICYVAGVCTSVWPFGTLLCGPTAAVCVYYYWTT